jgi:L-rhamnose isomerase/sugar isomerase
MRYETWRDEVAPSGLEIDRIKEQIKAFVVETPSWGYGNTGTRFKVFKAKGVPRTPYEKLQDAAQVHRLTGACPSVALHIPWDKVDDWADLKAYASSLGLRLGAINPNLFQEDQYKLGSVTHHDAAVRAAAVEHLLECVEIARTVGSDLISVWLADGTNYPGQGHLRQRRAWMEESLGAAYRTMDPQMRMLIEYKFFEPAWYHTDLPDWGTALGVARNLGTQAEVLVDIGHHPLGTNVAHVVANLICEQRLGGFHFNDRKYADDDLITGSINPYELFLIFDQLVDAGPLADRVAYMIDQSLCIEPKIPAMIRTVMNIQGAYAKALLINRAALREAQMAGDVLGAEGVMREAFETDVRPLLAHIREEAGLDPDPMRAYRASGYQERVEAERTGEGMSW